MTAACGYDECDLWGVLGTVEAGWFTHVCATIRLVDCCVWSYLMLVAGLRDVCLSAYFVCSIVEVTISVPCNALVRKRLLMCAYNCARGSFGSRGCARGSSGLGRRVGGAARVDACLDACVNAAACAPAWLHRGRDTFIAGKFIQCLLRIVYCMLAGHSMLPAFALREIASK